MLEQLALEAPQALFWRELGSEETGRDQARLRAWV